MARLNKADLEQMGEEYFRSLEPERLVEVAKNLHSLAIEQLEKLELTSQTSSRPPSSDNPYGKPKVSQQVKGLKVSPEDPSSKEPSSKTESSRSGEKSGSTDQEKAKAKGFGQPKAGKQPGAKGKWRNQPLKAERIIEHYPQYCAACNASLENGHQDGRPYMGYYQLELVRPKSGLRVESVLHHYYGATCSCNHHSQAAPLEGELSEVAGRKVQLQLQEYTLVGPMLASMIASLSVRYRLSRAKIQEFLLDWTDVELSIGSIDRSIREAGFACRPVVEDLIEQLQNAEILHLDETPWYKSGHLCWLWVAMSYDSAVFFIGARTKEMLSRIITPEFSGWLVSDGYGAYRWVEHRQRCLAHLIRKALALTQAVVMEVRQLGQWLLDELRELIHTRTSGESRELLENARRRLQQVALLARESEHSKLKALAKEILADWDAVVAFVENPQLPVTNNHAERALRHAVIARRIGYGTRTEEGTSSYATLLSVIETCRLRGFNPWTYLGEVIATRRKGMSAPLMPQILPVATSSTV